MWGWYMSERSRRELNEAIKQKVNCSADQSTYECLRKLTIGELFANVDSQHMGVFHPISDDDFFAPNITDESYELSKR